MQKQGKKKFPATLKAGFEAIFSPLMYKGMKIMGTYTDMRFLYTVRNSMDVLDSGASVVIFPEDSSDGYHDELKGAFPGFVMLAEQYYNKTGEDVPVIPLYYHHKTKRMIIAEPISLKKLRDEGLDRYRIADKIKDEINGIYIRNFKK